MKIGDYYHKILMPANTAVSSMRIAGIPVSMERLNDCYVDFNKRIAKLEKRLTRKAKKKGMDLTFSAAHRPSTIALRQFLYGRKGLGLECTVFTDKTKQPATSAEALMRYASIANPRKDDVPEVSDLLKLSSLAKAVATYVLPFARAVRADGAIHPKFNWGVVRTPRLSASDPPVHQIPEKADKEVAAGIKRCFVPREKPCLDPEDWDPRKHGSCFKWDISGAEMAVRAAMLTKLFCKSELTLWDYIRNGKDPHGKTAALMYDTEDGTYKKGDYERDVVGKISNFSLLYGGSSYTLQRTLLLKARVFWTDEESALRHGRFFEGYPELAEMYEWDKAFLGKNGYCQDGYGRRRWIELPANAKFLGIRFGKSQWRVPRGDRQAWRELDHCFHVAANTPTQGMSATDNLWMLALCFHGEYVELRVVPMWEDKGGVLFPEAKNWQFHEGPGPGGKPFKAWHTNTVHDSGWGDCGPGYVEPVMKVIARRCSALPFDWRLKADVPYRVDLEVGPDMGNLRDYNDVAKEFGLEPMPVR